MGNTIDDMILTLQDLSGYGRYFEEAFGTSEITPERVAKAIADYERTRMSGNSPWDRWRAGDEDAVSSEVKQGHDIFFFGKAACNQCHLGPNLADDDFHNLGVGWNDQTEDFSDEGRYAVTNQDKDRGAFKTPTIREVTKRAPYMHDGSMATLREVVEHYNKGGNPNPYLDSKMKPLELSDDEVNAVVEFMKALEGSGYQDKPPASFPN